MLRNFVKNPMWNKGKHGVQKHSEETRRKIGEAQKGNKYNLGKKLPLETRQKMSLTKKGKTPKNIVAGWNKGKKMSIEYKKNISVSLLGKSGEESRNWKGGTSHMYKIKNAPRPKPELCELCNGGGRICFDHNHNTGKFRGWICLKCNVALGMVGDNPEVLTEMIKYLN